MSVNKAHPEGAPALLFWRCTAPSAAVVAWGAEVREVSPSAWCGSAWCGSAWCGSGRCVLLLP
eukprot:262694-Chlamydomonas_euryale.AAC.5